MGREAFPGGEQAPAERVIAQDGSIDEHVLSEQFGLGIEEATQEVRFGGYVGTVAQMLDDERCPVGGMVRTAYQEKGITGVAEKLHTLSALDPQFSVRIGETTMNRAQLKKK